MTLLVRRFAIWGFLAVSLVFMGTSGLSRAVAQGVAPAQSTVPGQHSVYPSPSPGPAQPSPQTLPQPAQPPVPTQPSAPSDASPDPLSIPASVSPEAALRALEEPIPVPVLTPRQQDRIIARNFAAILTRSHLIHPQIDDEVSRRAFKLFFESLDPLKLYFSQQDYDEFRKYETDFDDIVKSGDLTVPFAIYNRYLQRFNERTRMIAQLLRVHHDFTVDEEMIRDKDLLSYPKTDAEAYDRWRRRIKFDILVLRNEARNRAKEQEKKRENAANGQNDPSKPGPSKVKPEEDENPVVRLARRYNGNRKRILLVNDKGVSINDEVLELFLTSISSALDPHSTYMSPSNYQNFMIQIALQLQGIGATLTSEDGYTVIKGLVKGGPAKRSGLVEKEDKIIAVGQGKNGPMEDVVDWKLTDVVNLIRGKEGTTVRLEIIPADGSGRKTIEIVREMIKLKDNAAKSQVFEAGKKPDGSPYRVGVVNVPSFYFDMEAAIRGDKNPNSTTTDVKAILKDFVEQDVDVVVMDLRFNGGGSLPEAVRLTGLFISTGNVVQTREEKPNQPVKILPLNDEDPSVDWTGPLVVVTNKISASASEIFAGAVKEYHRGLIVGDSRTHGKGSVQQMLQLGKEMGQYESPEKYGAMKLTIQSYHLPGGESPQLKGITPNVQLPSFTEAWDDVLEEDLDYALEFENIPPAAHFPVFSYTSPEIDRKLQELSDQRVAGVGDFNELKRDVGLYKEIKNRKTVTLNEEKYYADLDRLNSEKKEKESIEKMMGGDEEDAGIERDYYLDEVLNITSDYMNELQRLGIAFPQERSKAPRRPLNLNIFGGL